MLSQNALPPRRECHSGTILREGGASAQARRGAGSSERCLELWKHSSCTAKWQTRAILGYLFSGLFKVLPQYPWISGIRRLVVSRLECPQIKGDVCIPRKLNTTFSQSCWTIKNLSDFLSQYGTHYFQQAQTYYKKYHWNLISLKTEMAVFKIQH